MKYLYDNIEDKEVMAMEGITKIDIPEIEGLRETFAESTAACGTYGQCAPGPQWY